MASDNQLVVAAGVALQTKDPETLTLAVAIALAESGGNESITHTNSNGTIDVGAWQINSVHRRTHPNWTTAWLKVLENNAQAMAEVSGGGSNWSPWATYTNGRYQQFMDRARTAVGNTPTSSDPITGLADKFSGLVPDPLADIAEAAIGFVTTINDAARWIGDPSNWVRVVQVVGGILLGIAAVNIVIKPVVEDKLGEATKIIAKGIK
jgi:Lysozyme like domain